MASARWYSSPLSALPHGLDLSLSLWLQDEGRTLIASAKAQAKSNLQVRGDMSSSIYAITVTGSLLSSCLAAVQFRVKLLLSSLLTWSLKSDLLDSLFQSIPHSLQNVQRVNSKEKYYFFEWLTSNKRVNRNLLNNASLLQLSKIKKHGCCQHEKALERKNNRPQTHFHFKWVNFTRRWKWLGTLLPKLGFRGGGETRPAACIKCVKQKRPGSWVWEIHSCCLAWRDTVEVLWLVYLRANSVQLWKKTHMQQT